jgi:chemotaxis protein CheD
MGTVIDVPTASYALSAAPNSISTIGVGSCIVTCLYSESMKVGVLLHYMLPRLEKDTSNPYRYADTAISTVLKELATHGIDRHGLKAKVVGGGQMFANLAVTESIGKKNIDETYRLLRTLGIPIMASDVGGNVGRSVIFDLTTGAVTVTKPALDQTITI